MIQSPYLLQVFSAFLFLHGSVLANRVLQAFAHVNHDYLKTQLLAKYLLLSV